EIPVNTGEPPQSASIKKKAYLQLLHSEPVRRVRDLSLAADPDIDPSCRLPYAERLVASRRRTIMLRAALLLCLAGLSSLPLAAGNPPLFEVDTAMAQSQATGRPILAIAGSTGCV